MGKKSDKLKRIAIATPQSLDEASAYVAAIAEEQRTIDKLQAEFNQKVKELQEQAVAAVKPHSTQVEALVEGVYAFAQSRQAELIGDGKKKSVDVPAGTFGWRLTPPAVSITGVEDVLERLKKMKLQKFIRTKEEIDKEAMLKDQEQALKVEGVSIGQREEFFVKPTELKVEVVKKLKKETKKKSK